MRIARFLDESGKELLGRLLPDGRASLLEGEIPGELGDTGRVVMVGPLRRPLLPTAILGIGLNYRDHAKETGQPLPERPVLFMKNPGAAWHPEEPILLRPEFVERPEVDFEGELAVVIGSAARDAPEERALEHVFGYMVGNDVSARRVQKQTGGGQWVRGKSFDTFCPLGPVLVTADEVPDPQALRITTRLNGQVMQDSSTSEMIFTVAQLIADLSQGTTLLPGTVIMTGTPAGVGFARDPRVFLKPGDLVEIEIAGLGTLRNPVQAAT
ncbi:MAG: fumarylacetoacetate hydrolase family protein [Polyangia bacterium]|jgi:2-keto-4-pentenoate hydratase/2-oxohepta-3-ene-1,7-dioic acid hydratase in catechol pathway|nr:fumarylacetoacetate hydrolase family protein [Polyangia bacterium]